jgi:uroporphyrinogen-III synthase
MPRPAPAKPRILVTREDAEPLAGLLAAGGAQPVHVPLLRLAPTGAPPPEGRPDSVLVTSAAAVRFAVDVAPLRDVRVVAVGLATARALAEANVQVAAVGRGAGADAVPLLGPGTAWHVGAVEVSPELRAALAGTRVQRWAVYRNEVPPDTGRLLAEALPVDVLTFCSGSAVRAFAAEARAGEARVAVLGSSTASVAKAAGLPVDAVAARLDLEALAEAALSLCRGL